MSEQKQFDTGREISLKIPGPAGIKTAAVRWPTDAEWIERAAAQRIVIRQLGREKSTTEAIGSEEADLALFNAIRIGEGESFDRFEAAAIIARLSRCTVGEPAMDGPAYRIPLTVPGAETIHTLKPPSVARMAQHRRATVQAFDLRHGAQEIRVKLKPVGELYDELLVAVEGYAADVPIIHKSAVVSGLLREMDALIEGDGEGF